MCSLSSYGQRLDPFGSGKKKYWHSFHEWERFVKYAAEKAIIVAEIFINTYKKRHLEEGGGEDG